MRVVTLFLIVTLLLPSAFGQSLMMYDSAKSMAKAPGEKDAKETDGTFILSPSDRRLMFRAKNGGGEAFAIPYDRVTSLLYERTSNPRYVSAMLISPLLLLTKGKKHFLTIQYKDGNDQGQYAIVRLDKTNYQDCLAAVEAQTGKRVDRTEER